MAGEPGCHKSAEALTTRLPRSATSTTATVIFSASGTCFGVPFRSPMDLVPDGPELNFHLRQDLFVDRTPWIEPGLPFTAHRQWWRHGSLCRIQSNRRCARCGAAVCFLVFRDHDGFPGMKPATGLAANKNPKNPKMGRSSVRWDCRSRRLHPAGGIVRPHRKPARQRDGDGVSTDTDLPEFSLRHLGRPFHESPSAAMTTVPKRPTGLTAP